jgi:hypothetical protein
MRAFLFLRCLWYVSLSHPPVDFHSRMRCDSAVCRWDPLRIHGAKDSECGRVERVRAFIVRIDCIRPIADMA